MAAEGDRLVGGIAVAPHHLAAQSARAVLEEGGDAIEAMVAAAACIAVVYPHMNGIGGDAFWLVHEPCQAPRAIDACGPAPATLDADFYRKRGLSAIPVRGPLAANTVAGTIGGWDLALRFSRERWGGRLALGRLLSDAIGYAEDGVPTTRSQQASTQAKLDEVGRQPGFAGRFLPQGRVPREGEAFVQRPMAATFRRLAEAGLDDFYRGELARSIAGELAAVGSPVTAADLAAYSAEWTVPLALRHRRGTLHNMTPPTQGVVSLMILGVAERLCVEAMDPLGADYVHALVEATKQAFGVRDREVTDPRYMKVDAQSLLEPAALDALAAAVDMKRARPWGQRTAAGDTVWMGTIDAHGRAVSFIQSIYHEFGSGVVLPSSGINWQNRGCSFALDPAARNAVAPGRKPFHTLNPALALLADGRTMVYGTMGGDGQPQTQAAVFTRYVGAGLGIQESVSAPRWLLGRTWGSMSESLKLESRFDPRVVAELARRGHEVELVGDFDEVVGHAGALVRHPSGRLEGGFDPRSDGAVAGP
ncbi:MAG: gamma-glutamyltransferase family protein [Usitatibacter sp.]